MTIRSLLIALLVVGAATPMVRAQNVTSDLDVQHDIAWLMEALHDESIVVQNVGNASWFAAADSNSRLILDRHEVIDVYLFEDHERAAAAAYQLSGERELYDVYLEGGLVVVRRTRSQTSISADLRKLLGAAI